MVTCRYAAARLGLDPTDDWWICPSVFFQGSEASPRLRGTRCVTSQGAGGRYATTTVSASEKARHKKFSKARHIANFTWIHQSCADQNEVTGVSWHALNTWLRSFENRVKEPGRKNPAVAIGMVLDVISAARSRRRRPESGSFLHPAGAAPDAI